MRILIAFVVAFGIGAGSRWTGIPSLAPHLGYHLKTGHTLSVQNRPTGLAEDVIVLPCFSVRLQGADCVVEAVLDA